MHQRYKVTLEYDGSPYMGWQLQKHGKTVQGVLEQAVQQLFGAHAEVYGSGRTDAGVHALGQVAHVDLPPRYDAYRLQAALNGVLRPEPIAVLAAEAVPATFHARFSAQKRRYLYKICNRHAPLTLMAKRAWLVPTALNLAAMQEAAALLIGNHDFTSFRSAQCQAASPVKTLDTLDVCQTAAGLITIEATARSFLHHQVRNLVGTLKEVGEGLRRPENIPDIFKAKNRSAAGVTAPAQGLYFCKVWY